VRPSAYVTHPLLFLPTSAVSLLIEKSTPLLEAPRELGAKQEKGFVEHLENKGCLRLL
jgi:hypothetical protein